MKRVIFASGGSGGHLAPAIALAQLVRPLGISAVIATTQKQVDRRLQECYPEYDFVSNNGSGFDGSLKSFWKFLIGLGQGLFPTIKLLTGLKIELAFATGGFGCAPVVIAAALLGIPVAIHESNSVPGKVSRFFAPIYSKVFITRLMKAKPRGFRKAEVVGFPLRTAVSNRDEDVKNRYVSEDDRKLLTVFGGSQGAKALTEFVELNEARWAAANIAVVCVTGPVNYQPINKSKHIRYIAFVEDMPALYRATDLLIARSGAGSLAEIAEYQCPVVLVPLPSSADNHQEENAKVFVEAGCASLLGQEKLGESADYILGLIENETFLKQTKESQKAWSLKNQIDSLLVYICAEKNNKWV